MTSTGTSAFEFIQNGSQADICHHGSSILSLTANVHFFGGFHWARDQKLRVGKGPQVASLPLFSAYPVNVTEVRYDARPTDDGLALTIVPTNTATGTKPLQPFLEQVCLTVSEVDGNFIWRQQWSLTVHEDIDTGADGIDSIMRIYWYPMQDGSPGVFLQYADPQPVNASGPAVPMTRDWMWQFEPYVGPDSFRQHWQRRYTDILFQDPDGGYSISDLNKTKWHNLTLDNRRARPCHAQGMLYLLEENNEGIAAEVEAPSHYHHVCEWGMDFHFWLDLRPFLEGTVLPAGTALTATTTWRHADAAETGPLIAGARKIELTERERFFANLPAYEEPENSFTVSVLSRLDAQHWQPTSEGCAWQRDGGCQPGTGCLLIHNNYSRIGEWLQPSLGPSQWGNPLVGGARYRFSAMVRVTEIEWDGNFPGPQIGVVYEQFNGPSAVPGARRERIDGGWSAPLLNLKRPDRGELDWTPIELITVCPSYVLVATLILRFTGRGKAFFASVRWELLDDRV